ncbi:MAG: hypothetical protein GY789_28330 [Hyphomicrobiales bacterium]|nr:hypothetical protein [Hyphomicrobiales bacterium]MCP5001868.1 hypothetical protein [Hyphomicrobiales bacterium]
MRVLQSETSSSADQYRIKRRHWSKATSASSNRRPDDLNFINREAFAPTFVLFEDGREIGRMRGYAGDDFFCVLLAEMMEKLPK